MAQTVFKHPASSQQLANPPHLLLPSTSTMAIQSRLPSFGALDRFDNGAGIFSLPLEYHDLFRFAHSLSNSFPIASLTDEEGHELVRVDPFAVDHLTRLIHDLLLRIGAASYGGVLPNGDNFPLFRNGSFNELGLVTPPLLHLLHRFEGRLPFSGALPTHEHQFWMEELATAITDTREWLTTAQRRTTLLSPFVGWQWTAHEHLAPDFEVSRARATEIRIRTDGLNMQISPAPLLVWPLEEAPEFVGVVRVRLTAETIDSDSEDDSDDDADDAYLDVLDAISVDGLSSRPPSPSDARPLSAPPGLSTALIPHPIYGLGAQNAVVPYNPVTSLQNNEPVIAGASSSMALIPHPIYGPGAQNALVLYRVPTLRESAAGPSAPPNSRAATSTPPPPYSREPSGDRDDVELSDDEGDEDDCVEVRRGDLRAWPIYVGSDDEDEFD